MPTHLRPLTLAIILGFAAPLSAQEAATGDETATEETATEEAPAATDPAADLGAGETAETEPQEGQAYIREEFGDWALRCLRAAEGPDPCQLYQLLRDEEGNAVAEFTIFPLPEGGQAAAGATIVAPLETLLTEQLRLSVDGGAQRAYPFAFCNPAGGVARVGFTEAEIDQFRRGAEATLRIVPAAAPDQEVVLPLSLTGFTAGFEAQQALPTTQE